MSAGVHITSGECMPCTFISYMQHIFALKYKKYKCKYTDTHTHTVFHVCMLYKVCKVTLKKKLTDDMQNEMMRARHKEKEKKTSET